MLNVTFITKWNGTTPLLIQCARAMSLKQQCRKKVNLLPIPARCRDSPPWLVLFRSALKSAPHIANSKITSQSMSIGTQQDVLDYQGKYFCDSFLSFFFPAKICVMWFQFRFWSPVAIGRGLIVPTFKFLIIFTQGLLLYSYHLWDSFSDSWDAV